MLVCTKCNRSFKDAHALNQHSSHCHPCIKCARFFKSQSALDQHLRSSAAHRNEPLSIWDIPSPEDIPVPVDSPGHWIARELFDGHKSFGYFFCLSAGCSKKWLSAHSFTKYEQGCTLCKNYELPFYMWVNEPGFRASRDSDADSEEDRPHIAKLCKA